MPLQIVIRGFRVARDRERATRPDEFPRRGKMSGGFEDLGLMPELVRATQEMGWL
jgi:hypothetical protein